MIGRWYAVDKQGSEFRASVASRVIAVRSASGAGLEKKRRAKVV
jgi:hypothetical protein